MKEILAHWKLSVRDDLESQAPQLLWWSIQRTQIPQHQLASAKVTGLFSNALNWEGWFCFPWRLSSDQLSFVNPKGSVSSRGGGTLWPPLQSQESRQTWRVPVLLPSDVSQWRRDVFVTKHWTFWLTSLDLHPHSHTGIPPLPPPSFQESLNFLHGIQGWALGTPQLVVVQTEWFLTSMILTSISCASQDYLWTARKEWNGELHLLSFIPSNIC